MRAAVMILAAVLGGCSTIAPPPHAESVQPGGWRVIATPHDRERLRDWRSTFVEAVRSARANGHARDIAAEGALLDPDSGIGGPLPDGEYRCRTIKVGSRSGNTLSFVAYPFFRCRVAPGDGYRLFVKETGSQRQVGAIYPADAMRQVFLGTLVLGDERRAMRYGTDRDRDVAAWVERIAPDRWRLVMPRPAFESQLDILELVPMR